MYKINDYGKNDRSFVHVFLTEYLIDLLLKYLYSFIKKKNKNKNYFNIKTRFNSHRTVTMYNLQTKPETIKKIITIND